MAIIGIDLGTTNSAVAVMKDGKPIILENNSGGRTTPSVVHIDLNGTIVVGENAISGLVSAPDRTVLEVKTMMGTDENFILGDRTYRPEEISAMILKQLKKDAEDKLGEPVTEAVITVPAYFTDAQRKVTQKAGEIAGLKVERIINEPTAAALSFGIENMDREQHIIVYDLGGGTFDVSVVELFDGILEVKATAGDNHLGGSDFDREIVKWIVERVKETHQYDLLSEGSVQEIHVRNNRLKLEAERVKKVLSSAAMTKINLPFFAFVNGAPLSIELDISRTQFEQLIRGLVERTIVESEKALSDAGISVDQIDEVLLVGGSTRIPYVQDIVQKKFGKIARKDINPDEAVALGAAIQAGIKSGDISSKDGLMITDVAPYTLGLQVTRIVGGQKVPGFFDPLIERNTVVPCTNSKIYYTNYEDQDTVNIKIYQGDDSYADNNHFLGDLQLPGIPPGPAGQEIRITFQYTINGVLNVEAEIVSTGKKVSSSIKNDNVMSEEQLAESKAKMEQAFEQSEFYADVKTLINRAEKMMLEVEDNDRFAIETLLNQLKKAVRDQDKVMVEKYEEELTDLLIEVV